MTTPLKGLFQLEYNVGRAAKRTPLPERKDSYNYSNLIPEHKMKDEKTTSVTSIPDEVMREIEVASAIYANPMELIELSTPVLNHMKRCREDYSTGAQAFYLKGREDAVRAIVEWLRSDEAWNHEEDALDLVNCKGWANSIEENFLKGTK